MKLTLDEAASRIAAALRAAGANDAMAALHRAGAGAGRSAGSERARAVAGAAVHHAPAQRACRRPRRGQGGTAQGRDACSSMPAKAWPSRPANWRWPRRCAWPASTASRWPGWPTATTAASSSTTCARQRRPAGRPRLLELAGGDAGRRRQAPDLRHQPGGGGVSAPRRRSAADRPEPERGRARQGDGGGEEGQPIPPGWALDAAGQPTTDAQAALDRLDAAAGRGVVAEGRDAGAGGRTAGHGRDRRELRLRGLELLRRRRQPAASGAAVRRHRPGRAGRQRGLLRAHRGADHRDG